MAKNSLDGLMHRLRKLAAVQKHRHLCDRELLHQFVDDGDEAAFTMLVERHGPMVHSVCRRILGNTHDADDACQAAFLVLARKAGSIRKCNSISSWLHGVACRVAADLKRRNARQRRREQSAAREISQDLRADLSWRDAQTVLDEELRQLPERYRSPLILCYLQGRTRDEAAQQLGITAGCLHGRLERGRKLLRQRLVQRGLNLSGALLAAALSDSAIYAVLPATFVVTTSKAAVLFAACPSAAKCTIPAKILALTQEVLKVMFLTKVKVGSAMVLIAALFSTFLGGALVNSSSAQEQRRADGVWEIAVDWQDDAHGETDEQFIRRISRDLRGKEPTPAEVHFFGANKDPDRRQKLIDLFIAERQATKQGQLTHRNLATRALWLQNQAASEGTLWLSTIVQNAPGQWSWMLKSGEKNVVVWEHVVPRDLLDIQRKFLEELQAAAKAKQDTSSITATYLNQLITFVKENPKSADIPDAMLQISLVYRSQSKSVEADAWRAKLLKEYPNSPAAHRLSQGSYLFLTPGIHDISFRIDAAGAEGK